ncbi:MAG: carnitinyl-CoA dehydratase [Rhodospirillaceae bacterium]|jgi:crotonobetainyl-CoA hydratase|nr:carnitinyl-CoA dehydratase [Rhodospirillaceae bacterium]MBT6511719.1 carnitinyl-CoA dehydratase [Rhodospirillaceae bacterium]
MGDAVRTQRNGAVLEITIDRPKANAIDAATSRALAATITAFQNDDSLRVAILTGSGERIFSAGWDLSSAGDGDSDWGEGGWCGLCERHDLDKPVIAAVNGACVAGGLELALACDFMIAADHAQFFLSEATLGLTVDIGTIPRLMARVPQQVALEMLYTGRRLDAAQALAMGLVLRSVPAADLMASARELADRIVASAPLSVAALKQMAQIAGSVSPEMAYAARDAGRLTGQARARDSEDAAEGPRAYMEKRAPVWKGS